MTNTEGPEYRRWERGIERALDDMDKERYACLRDVVRYIRASCRELVTFSAHS